MNRVEPIRGQFTALFLSYISPHEPVGRDTISRWVVFVLTSAGVNTERFGAHSTRGAGVSAGAALGLTADTLLKYGSWKSQVTMAKYYLREIQDDEAPRLGEGLLDRLG